MSGCSNLSPSHRIAPNGNYTPSLLRKLIIYLIKACVNRGDILDDQALRNRVYLDQV